MNPQDPEGGYGGGPGQVFDPAFLRFNSCTRTEPQIETKSYFYNWVVFVDTAPCHDICCCISSGHYWRRSGSGIYRQVWLTCLQLFLCRAFLAFIQFSDVGISMHRRAAKASSENFLGFMKLVQSVCRTTRGELKS